MRSPANDDALVIPNFRLALLPASSLALPVRSPEKLVALVIPNFKLAVVVDNPAALPVRSPANDDAVNVPTFIFLPPDTPVELPGVFP